MRTVHWTLILILITLCSVDAASQITEPEFFPVVTQFSPVPSGEGWKGEEGPLSAEVLYGTIDNILAHGFTGIQLPTKRPPDEEAIIRAYAQSKGMIITYHGGALEGFGRDKPPAPSVYSPEYAAAVRAHAEKALAPLKDIPNLYNVFTYQDEPFHWGPQSFGYGEEVKAEFKKRYGYDLPLDPGSVKENPQQWLDLITFRTANFPDGWKQVYAIIKEINPDFKAVLTHDSHNTFGAGYSSHCEIAIDDVFEWGGDFADMFVFDLYPYMMFDFRFGDPSVLQKPRISQTHYTFAQMRALTNAYDKDLGFWVGTYNPAWFGHFLCDELAALHWAEQEMSMTAVAHGADYLLTGYNIPVDAKHWDSFGKGLNLIQKAGVDLLDTPRVQAKACMLFPRTQYIQLQEEYFNVGLSFELFLRAFGELDIIHEQQIREGILDKYEILTLFDVALLPEDVAARIVEFTRNGGTVIADCIPQRNHLKQPLSNMQELFGVKDAKTDRILRAGHWVPYVDIAPMFHYRPEDHPDEVSDTDVMTSNVLDQEIAINLTSLRPFTITDATLLASTESGKPALSHRKAGKGNVYLLGFCLQDTYFKTWQDDDVSSRNALRDLLHSITQEVNIKAHVHSSTADIEASIRANEQEGFLFVINHESVSEATTVTLRDLDFDIARIISLEDDSPVAFKKTGTEVTLDIAVARDGAKILHVLPEPAATENNLFTLWQLPNQTPTQMMSYVIKTQHDKVIVIDGGNAGDAPYLAKFIEDLGNKVEAWIITHPHSDHFNALCEILKNPGKMEIKAFYGSMPDEAWVVEFCSEPEQNSYRLFTQTMSDAGRSVEELALGQVFEIDGVKFEVLGIKNPEITGNPINNSSLVFRVEDAEKSILFTGDLGPEGSEKLLKSPLADRLPADYVQMSHHGQNGATEAFYNHVGASYCLWPAPLWLYDVDNGGGKGSGPWKTLEVRAWMDKMPIKKHYLMHEGLQKIPASRAIGIRESFEKETKASYETLKPEIEKLVTVDFDLSPQLILPGETVTLNITARSATPPNSTLEFWEHCHAESAAISNHQLEWKQESENLFTASMQLNPETCGNHLVHWKSDVPGDIPEFWRNIAVVDKGCAVMILNSTSHRDPRPEPEFHRLHLPFSYWSEILLFGPRGAAPQFTNYSKGVRQYGDDPGMLIFLGGEYVPGDKTVWYDEPEAVQRTVLEGYKELWAFCGFPKPLDSLYTYGMGNEVVDIARDSGVRLLGALCANQNWGDGPFKINHWGMPSRPYFIAKEDFRKPGTGGVDAMVGIQQCERHSVLCRDYNCVYSFESGIVYALDQYAGITRPRVVDDMILSREMDFLECFLNAAEHADQPYLFSCGFEMNGVWPEMAAINTWFMEYLVKKSRTDKIAFTNAAMAADFMRRHYEKTPETVLYLNDVYAGLESNGKPALYPDTMEIENAAFRATFRHGDTLPYAQYDYTIPWDYPDWGNEDIPRKEDGYVIPDAENCFDITPKIIDTRPYKVTVDAQESAVPDKSQINIIVEAAKAQQNLALAVWDIPREFSRNTSDNTLTGAKRFVPIRASYTGNFCGIIIVDIQEGRNEILLEVSSKPRKPESIDLQLSDAIHAKVFERDGKSTAYLFNTGDTTASVVCTPPENSMVSHYPFDSDAAILLNTATTLTIAPKQCQRLTGLTRDQLRTAVTRAP